MQYLSSILRKHKDQLLLVALVLIAWWPISTFQYVPKWDNIDCYLPYRYFVSWSEHNGHLPLWNPFQHMGYPAYSDMQNGMYNPFVQLLIWSGGYSPTSLVIELLTYVVTGALGAYRLSQLFVTSRWAKFLAGLCFGLSGFMLGTAQIMIFLAGAAFLPWILYHFWMLLKDGSLKQIFLSALYIALEATVASPAFTIILIYLLVGLTVIYFWLHRKNKSNSFLRRWYWQFPLLGLILILLLFPYIISVLDFLPYFGRANQLEYGPYLLQNPFDFRSWFSFLFPYPTLADSQWFRTTDLTMRSAYFGWLPFLFALFSLKFFKEKKIALLWIGTVVFALVCAGGSTPIYRLIYEIPGFGLFRHPSLFRAHLILCLILLASIGLEQWMKDRRNLLFRTILFSFAGLTLSVLLWSVFKPHWQDIKVLFSWHQPSEDWKPHYLKSYFLLNTLLVLPMCLATVWLIRSPKPLPWLIGLIALDLLLYSQVTLPATVHYPYKRADYEAFFKALPRSVNEQSAAVPYASLIENYEPKMMGIWRNTATYFKSLSFDGHNQTQFKGFNLVEKNGGLDFAKQNPLFYEVAERINLKKDTIKRPNCLTHLDAVGTSTSCMPFKINKDTLRISNPTIGFNQFSTMVDNRSTQSDLIILNQNFHKGWSARLNGKPLKIHLANQAFMAIEIPPHVKGKVIFSFDAPNWRKSLWISGFSWFFLLLTLLLMNVRKRNIPYALS
jgi:hypothetical protein